MKTFKFLCSLWFWFAISPVSAQGKLDILVSTNVNKLSCYCNESDFILHQDQSHKTEIEFPLKAFRCQKKIMEKDLQKLFESKIYPTIKLTVNEVVDDGKEVKANVTIQIKEIKKQYNLLLEKQKENKEEHDYYFVGIQNICLTDFNIDPPVKALGLVKVKDQIKITFCIPTSYILSSN
ncbi:YceI family protein [Zhouia sp. PK063]|uniref:YceI family protein n=1 Tax=Zhouia sp. PK063 TaxID=3373602 RepID=UPI0037BA0E41